MDETFTESGFANDQAAIVILNGAGDDFGGGGGVVVDEDDEGHVHALIAAHGVEAALRGAAAVVGDDELILFENMSPTATASLRRPPGLPRISRMAIEGIGAKLFEGVGDFAVGGVVELRESNVADAGLDEERDVHGMTGDFVAGDSENERIGVAFAGDDDLDDSALGALERSATSLVVRPSVRLASTCMMTSPGRRPAL